MTKTEIQALLREAYWQVRRTEKQVDLVVGPYRVRVNPVIFQPTACVYGLDGPGGYRAFSRLDEAVDVIHSGMKSG